MTFYSNTEEPFFYGEEDTTTENTEPVKVVVINAPSFTPALSATYRFNLTEELVENPDDDFYEIDLGKIVDDYADAFKVTFVAADFIKHEYDGSESGNV